VLIFLSERLTRTVMSAISFAMIFFTSWDAASSGWPHQPAAACFFCENQYTNSISFFIMEDILKRTISNSGRIIAVMAALALCTAGAAHAQSLDSLKKNVDEFSEKLALSLPFNSSMGLNWSDAYIGQFLGVPPHFGAGLSLGFTTMDGDALGSLMHQFDLDLPLDLGGYPIPGYTVEGRIGGFFLPFDVGVKFGYLPIKPESIELDYLLIGGDFRYAVLKGNIVLPTISVGVGFNYLNGGLARTIGDDRTFTYTTGSSTTETLTLKAPKVGFVWETSSLDFKAQVSKSLLIFTPYVGIGASHAWSKAGYNVESKLSSSGSINDAISAMKAAGITDISVNNGFASIKEVSGWSVRAFGGLSFNLPLLKIDLTGLINFLDARYGVTLGARFQI
jgi:hypothetical protein